MTDKNSYLDFNKVNDAQSHQQVISRLRSDLKKQQGWIKWLFFTSEYNETKKLLSLDNDKFVQAMMKKERSLYLKSIVICTTGPMELTRSFFGDYMIPTKDIDKNVKPYTMSTYNLDKAFLSNNVIPLHQNIWGMLRYLGRSVGELNDSSWLEEGQQLIQTRQEKLIERQHQLMASLPDTLLKYKEGIHTHIAKLENDDKGWFAFFGRNRRQSKIQALKAISACFNESDKTIDINQLKTVMENDILPNKAKVYAGFFSHKTKDLIEGLNSACHEGVVLRVFRSKTPSFANTTDSSSSQTMARLSEGLPPQSSDTSIVSSSLANPTASSPAVSVSYELAEASTSPSP